MLERIQLNRPSLNEIPNAIRLFGVAQKANKYIAFAPAEMNEAGLFASSREGIWMYLTEENLRPLGAELSLQQKVTLIDLFSVLRRIYKSADDAWDQSQEVRDFISDDPLSRVTGPLRWNNQGVENITHLSPLFDYLDLRLNTYFQNDREKRERIKSVYETFVKNAAFALVDFEELQSRRQPEWRECLDFYDKTTGAIGKAIGTIVNELVDGDENSKQKLQINFREAALVSQLADDVRDLPLDMVDQRSPSVIKAMIQADSAEQSSISYYALGNISHISYRIFKQLAPQTAASIEKVFLGCINGLPKKIQRFLKDFYYTLPPAAVSHEDPLNKGWHTNPEADYKVSTYVKRNSEDEPYSLVDFVELGSERDGSTLAILIDPGKQSLDVVLERAQKFIDSGGRVILIGGSMIDEPSVFQETVDAITSRTRSNQDISVIIFPGDINQIPQNGDGVKGVLNYRYILGSPDGNKFETVFPKNAQLYVERTLRERKINSSPTLYVLCGDSKSSVSQVTGIVPLDLQQADQVSYLLTNLEKWLKDGIACIYLEGGSGSSRPVSMAIVHRTKELIKRYSPRTLLFVGGGINSPEGVSEIRDDSDCVVIGTHFKNTDANDVN